MLLQLAHVLEIVDRPRQLHASGRAQLAHAPGLLGDFLDAVQLHLVGDLLGEVDHVVERGRQQQDVLLVHGRHEGAVGEAVQLVGDVVGAVLEVAKPRMPGGAFEQALTELRQHFRNQLALLGEKFVELALLRDQAEFHVSSAPSWLSMRRATATAEA